MKFEVMFEIKKTNGLTTIKQTNFAYFWLYSIYHYFVTMFVPIYFLLLIFTLDLKEIVRVITYKYLF